MATTQTTQRGVDTELKEELADYVGATEGDVIYGQVREVTEKPNGDIRVRVWIPTNEVISTSFDYPKPPLEDWDFTRFAKTYGHGLVDLDGLVGSQIPCQYDRGKGWKVQVPEPEKSKRERLRSLFTLNIDTGKVDFGDFFVLLCSWPIAIFVFSLVFLIKDTSNGNDTLVGVGMSSLITIFWLISALLFYILL